VKKAPAQPALSRDAAGLGEVPSTPDAAGGAAAGAAVLTAVDEDDEDGEEAPVPNDFDYLSDNEGGDD
jgi:26S proteasome regulatory subunit N2